MGPDLACFVDFTTCNSE